MPAVAAAAYQAAGATREQQQPPPPPLPTGVPAASTSPANARRLPPGGIQILLLEGHKVRNSLLSKTAISPVVQVLDSQDQPITGAAVTFEVSPTGPGGHFGVPPDPPTPTVTVRTDFAGQATAHFTPNAIAGRFSIKVTAAIEGQTAVAGMVQTNDPSIAMAGPEPPKRHWYQSWKWWAVIGGGAVAAIIVLTRSSSKSPTIIISPAPIDIGGPR
jgi:hypothetical protein